MACRGVHFAITDIDAERLLSAPDHDAALDIVQEDIEERWDEEWLYQSDKAWDAIHRCLSDGSLNRNGGNYPLKLTVLGGRQLYSGDDYIISLVMPEEVRDVAIGLSKVDQDWFRDRYDAIDPNESGIPKTDDDWAYTWENFAGVVLFFQKAARENRYVVFTVDQ